MKSKEVKKQYKTSNNLQARMQIHNRYSMNSYGWGRWVFDQYVFPFGIKILELGCGTGGQWRGKKEVIEKEWDITLTDQSPGMLKRAQENTKNLSQHMTYQVVNAEEIPFEDETFDAVIANHMIYHIPDKEKAIKEMARVIKPKGKLYCTTLGINNMVELGKLLTAFDPRIDFLNHHVARHFGLENGGQMLRKEFKSVEIRRYKDGLLVKEPDPLYEYILSLKGFGNTVKIIEERGKDAFEEYIYGLFYDKEHIPITKDGGMFIARK
ncbi:class I SAM-dependent methyltransferase [Vallitalea okinawensis]|uniref:class I SAM-dependent methyltransferase n=1 Tax=Vallitalea okinawensis TaxID=2078660 RepID=UPI000CFCB9B6|nr:class I SAM-dependent methyltransferase [Vallitalea okinawensis]